MADNKEQIHNIDMNTGIFRNFYFIIWNMKYFDLIWLTYPVDILLGGGSLYIAFT